MADAPVVHVVDDDDGLRNALFRLLRNAGFPVLTHASAGAFMDQANPEHIGCLLLDVRMPGMTGLQLQSELNRREMYIPTIFLTGTADVGIAVAAMHAGAFDFIEKPYDNDELVARVRQAIDAGAQVRRELRSRSGATARLQRLTPRETEVLQLMTEGLLTKQIADRLNLSPRTVEVHRGRVMEKMEASSLASLVRMVLTAQRSNTQ